MCFRSSAVSPFVRVRTLTAWACLAAASSSASRNFLQSSWSLFSRFHIPASLLTSLAFSVSSLSRPVHDAPPRPEEPHLHRVRIQIQDLGNLFNRESFHLFQDQHQPVPLIQSIEQPFQARSEEHTSELQSHSDLVCRLLLEK